ncbi:glycosyltransferase [Acetobacter nitrogenifigens]|uniref:glycosyltransferase n=1 Tax=Acetobacter nitrogenifigens TaxID=285268 RepID=UPI00353136D9
MVNEPLVIKALEQKLRDAEALVDSYRCAASVHSMRADGLAAEGHALRETLNIWSGSKVVRVGRAVRLLWFVLHGKLPSGSRFSLLVRRAREIGRDEGLSALARRAYARIHVRRQQITKLRNGPATSGRNGHLAENVDNRSVAASRLTELTPKISIIAELTLRQCAKYRVWQKQEQLESLGWQVEVVDWRDCEAAITALQTSTEVIFYRVPAFDPVKEVIQEARRLSLSPWWEVDDLIFEHAEYIKNSNISGLSNAEKSELLNGVRLFRECLLSCDRAIASTRALGDAMRRAGIADVHVIENALDQQTLEIAARLRDVRGKALVTPLQDILIVYGSGTKTHDADFRECADGLLAAMESEQRLRLRIVGDLTLPEGFARVSERVEHIGGRDYANYMALLAEADIAVAPLEATLFNDAKSNIKFIEASILGVPSICSPRDTFRQVIQPGNNGLLAEGVEEWRDAFLMLARNPELRQQLAERAYGDVMARYRPDAIAATQVAACFPPSVVKPSGRLRIMAANIYFAPRTFGGATLIAEEMVKRLSERDVDVAVFTAAAPNPTRYVSSVRYEALGVSVLGSPLPLHVDSAASLDNPRVTRQFVAWLEAYRPDIVHFHSMQGLGLGVLHACSERGVPYIITVHDAWWLCERQFMVRKDGTYCAQRRIDPHVCQLCVPEARHLGLRADLMKQTLAGAALLLSPSEAHRRLYIENGVPSDAIRVNRNGFFWPKAPRNPRPHGAPLRFGYVGGVEAVKGYPLVREAFERLDSSDWRLVVIDNKLKLGFQSIITHDWKVKGAVIVRDAYSPDTMDDFFNEIDVLLFPSQWMESYGLTVREALARDVWVIATSPGGQSEDIVDGVNGTLMPLNSGSGALQNAIEKVLGEAGRFNGYANPLKHTLATFEDQADELLTILKEQVETRANQG